MDNVTFIENEYGEFAYTSEDSVNMSVFNSAEIEVLNAVYEKFKGFTAGEISEFSHQELAWLAVPQGNFIAYNFSNQMDPHRRSR